MGKHRKNRQYRRIIIAAVAVGVVGVPSVALACTDWPGSGGHQVHAAEKNVTHSWWNDPDWYHKWSADGGNAPASAAPVASTTAVSTPRAAAHRHWSPAPSHTPRTAAPRPTATVAPSTPKPTASASATPAPSSTPTAAPTATGAVARVVALVNAERGKVGCSPLTVNATLTKVAQAHSEDMAAHQNMSHTGSDGSSPGDRITSAGYNWSSYGENVAYGYATPEDVMAGWMSSPGHKANILNCSFKEIGVGLAQPGSYWTQDFGTAR